MTSIRRLLVGNLDCELRWAGHERLPRDVSAMVSAAAVGLRAFAEAGDVLWTMAPVAPERVAVVDGLPAIELVSGELPKADMVLGWGETNEVAAARPGLAPLPAHVGDGPVWWQRLWNCHGAVEAARACNERWLSFEISQALDMALPGARRLASLPALDAHLAAGGADAGMDGAWVLKAPLSASGRLRLRRRGNVLDGSARNRAARLFRRWNELVFEPWMERTEDFGQCGLVEDRGVTVFPPHRLECDPAGVFRATVLDDTAPWSDDVREPLARASAEVGRELLERGYRGAFGIDGFTYKGSNGEVGIQPLSEINARVSFGVIARVLAERLGIDRLELRLGRGPVPERQGVTALVHPGAEGTSLWFEAS